ncbi:Gpr1 family protein [Gymnopilus junonius]|uniref:Gpr1 family protein n=1 Tax=Gymnopilus junonius TaxID=109634 RepID=A0A9P5NHT4_GYMJU|nr:Gpr1 family protein [Gymnopilus junonius]
MSSVRVEEGLTKGEPVQAYVAQRTPCRIGNPGALGLFSFASTTFILSLYNLQTRGIHTPNAVVGMAIFCGGLVQLLAGMWEFPRGNAFGATAFGSYGALWMAYTTIFIPGSRVLSAYSNEKELASALGIFLIAWFMVTFFLLIASFRKMIGLALLFAFLSLTFLLLAIAEFTGKEKVIKAGGATGAITAFIAYYVGLAGLLASEDRPVILLPVGIFAPRKPN